MDDSISGADPDFLTLFHAAPNPYLVLTPDFRVVAANDAYCNVTRTERPCLVGHGLFEVLRERPGDAAATEAVRNLRASLARVLQFRCPDAMEVQKYDLHLPSSEGGGYEERHWSALNTPVINGDNRIAWIIHRLEDVTELVRVQARSEVRIELAYRQQSIIDQLRGAAGFLDAVIENLPGMLFVKSYPDARFVLFNRGGEQMIGFDRSELIGKTDYDVFTKAEADQSLIDDREVWETGATKVIPEEPINTRDRGVRLLRVTKVPVQDAEGRPQYMLGFAEDITERRAMEQQLRHAIKMEAIGQLTGGVAHDFNNLLGIIIGNLDIAADRASADPVLRECITDALNGALRGAELTRRLLAFSRKQPLQSTVIDLNRNLPQIARMLRRTLGENIVVELNSGAALWPVLIDPAQLDEAILNLAINARDAMPQGGVLDIETSNITLDDDYAAHQPEVKPGDYVQLSVSDNGSGMPPEVIERCFEPFFTTKGVEKGTGLGLSMVYGFVKQSGGHIKVYSELGHGTTVKVYLPRAFDDAMAGPADAATAGSLRGHELVLAVEDNNELLAVTVRQLGELGYRTLQAENAKAALETLAANPAIDLLFTDVVMPGGMNGAELAREAQRLYPGLKVLLTSGYAARATAGFHDIAGLELLQKPFRKNELALRLRKILDPQRDALES